MNGADIVANACACRRSRDPLVVGCVSGRVGGCKSRLRDFDIVDVAPNHLQ